MKGNNSGKGRPDGLLRSLGQWSRKRGNWNIELECKLRTVTIGGADLVLGHGLGSKRLRQDVGNYQVMEAVFALTELQKQ